MSRCSFDFLALTRLPPQHLRHQSNHWGQFLSEMGRLESVLQTSVQTLSTELPHSIDHTLVHFDAALGEGVPEYEVALAVLAGGTRKRRWKHTSTEI